VRDFDQNAKVSSALYCTSMRLPLPSLVLQILKTFSKLASFIGDPNFPEVAIQSSRGGKIRLYQDLYGQYSRLQFTRMGDKPIAISGLEKRLLQAFNTYGGFGVFDDGHGLLRRTLLWHRGLDENALERIEFSTQRQMMVPTWSWMAYKGGIDYLDLPFDGVDWEEKEVRSPWMPGSSGVWHTGDQAGAVELSAVARDFKSSGSTVRASKIIYDIPAKTDDLNRHVMCVVVGRRKGAVAEQDRMHYVLLVTSQASQVSRGGQVCERVGVGYIPGGWIKFDLAGTPVKIR
jgi:hypothetical protein